MVVNPIMHVESIIGKMENVWHNWKPANKWASNQNGEHWSEKLSKGNHGHSKGWERFQVVQNVLKARHAPAHPQSDRKMDELKMPRGNFFTSRAPSGWYWQPNKRLHFAGLILGLFEWNCYFGGSALIQSACFQAAVFMRSPDSLASHPPKARETTTKKAAAARTASWATDGGTDRGGAAGDPRRPQSPEGLTLTR